MSLANPAIVDVPSALRVGSVYSMKTYHQVRPEGAEKGDPAKVAIALVQGLAKLRLDIDDAREALGERHLGKPVGKLPHLGTLQGRLDDSVRNLDLMHRDHPRLELAEATKALGEIHREIKVKPDRETIAQNAQRLDETLSSIVVVLERAEKTIRSGSPIAEALGDHLERVVMGAKVSMAGLLQSLAEGALPGGLRDRSG